MVPLHEVGWRAAAALERTGGEARVLAVLSESHYVTAGDQIIWLGRPGAMLHGRAMVAAVALPDVVPGDHVVIDPRGARRWEPSAATARVSRRDIQAGGRQLAAALRGPDPPPGLGALIVGAPLAFPLQAAASSARALARACASDDPDAATVASGALIGLGPGLTPSGDDFVGGAFFARACLAARGEAPGHGWEHAAATVLHGARERTHPVSLALLGDLVGGHGHAPLHELAAVLRTGGPPDAALAAARTLARLGHSSGWDMLAGFLAGLGCL
jgi:hypothetical protein